MQGTIQNYTLDMADGTAPKPLIVKQGDTNSRQARISLKAFDQPWTIPFGCQIQINVRKNDGTYANATCTREDEHTVLAPITEQMTAASGTHLGELFFLGTDGDIRSQTFPLVAWDAVTDLDLMESANDFQALKDALRDVKISTDAAAIATQYATEQGNAARDSAQRAENAADSLQVAVDAAAAAKVSETNAKTSETAAAQTQQAVTDYVESQKAAFVGYSKRETDSKYANALTETATGEGGVTVEDAWTAPVLGLDVAGKSEQVVTTGKNLLNANMLPSRAMDGVAVTNNGDGSFTVSGSGALSDSLSATYTIPHDVCTDLFSAGAYKFMLSNGIRTVPYVYAKFENIMELNTDGKVVNLTDEMIADPNFSVRIGYYASAGATIYTGTTRPMLCKVTDDRPLPWEPYTGGAPSPSPDYPQDIISTGTVSTGAQSLDFEQCLKEWNSKYTQSNGRVYTVNALGTGFQNPISFSDEDIKVTLSGKVRDISGSRYRIELLDSSGNLVGRIDKDTKSITVMASKIRLNFSEGGTGEYADIMLNAGDTALPWEPYTGGKPSPSVEYPQEIRVISAVGGRNLILNSGTEVKNNNYILASYEPVKPLIKGENYTITMCITPAAGVNSINVFSSSGYMQLINFSVTGTGKRILSASFKMSYTSDRTPDVDIKHADITMYRLPNDGTVTTQSILHWVKIEKGTTATPWTPAPEDITAENAEQYGNLIRIAPITLTEPLRGIGDYRDRIMCREGVWGIERWVAEVIFDGSKDEAWSAYSGLTDYYGFSVSSALPEGRHRATGLCNQLRVDTIATRNKNRVWLGVNRNTIIYATCNSYYDDSMTDKGLANWKAHLAEYPLEVITYLDTPTWTPLPDATQQALNALTTYAGTTHLTITAGGTTPTVTLDYVQDTRKAFEQCKEAAKEYTDNQLANMVAALPTATQAAIVDNQTTKLLQEV